MTTGGKMVPRCAIAVRFTAPEGGVLKSVRFLITGEGNPTTSFGVQVLAPAADGSPGEPLWPSDGSLHTAGRSEVAGYRWVEVDLGDEDLAVSGDFFVVMEWLTAPGPGVDQAQHLALDLSQPDGRTWVQVGGPWAVIPGPTTAPASDAVIRATVEVPVGSLPAEPVVLRNVDDSCTSFTTLYAEVDGEGIAVARLAAERDFVLDFVRVQRAHTAPFGGFCDATIPAHVELFTGTGALPDAEPTALATFDVSPDEVRDLPVNQVDLRPATPVRVAAGEALFVAVHLNRNGAVTSCLDICIDPVLEGIDGWSYDTVAPHSWSTLTDIDAPANLNISAFGTDG